MTLAEIDRRLSELGQPMELEVLASFQSNSERVDRCAASSAYWANG
jgi:hypothetical protein